MMLRRRTTRFTRRTYKRAIDRLEIQIGKVAYLSADYEWARAQYEKLSKLQIAIARRGDREDKR